ncbi:MAG: hypothetical protein JO174_03695 [Herbaspirillum sp.]|nr:hypothetical protein [Herbaspirillum sp.]
MQITSPVRSAIQAVQQRKSSRQHDRGVDAGVGSGHIGFAGKNAYDAVKTGQGFAVEGKENPQVFANARNEDGSLKKGADGNPDTRDATAVDKVGGINLGAI